MIDTRVVACLGQNVITGPNLCRSCKAFGRYCNVEARFLYHSSVKKRIVFELTTWYNRLENFWTQNGVARPWNLLPTLRVGTECSRWKQTRWPCTITIPVVTVTRLSEHSPLPPSHSHVPGPLSSVHSHSQIRILFRRVFLPELFSNLPVWVTSLLISPVETCVSFYQRISIRSFVSSPCVTLNNLKTEAVSFSLTPSNPEIN